MAVTYRAIARYSSRRPADSPSSSSSVSPSFTLQPRHLLQQLGRVVREQCWKLLNQFHLLLLTHLAVRSFCFILWTRICFAWNEVLLRIVRVLLMIWYCQADGSGIEVTLNRDPSWSVSIYFTDSEKCASEIRQQILEHASKCTALKLHCRCYYNGRLEMWRTADGITVEEVPPVWRHRLVTEDTAQDYVSEICNRCTDEKMRPASWRLFFIPLDNRDVRHLSPSSCCIISQCHKRLATALDTLVRHALVTHKRSPPLPPVPADLYSTARGFGANKAPICLAWTRRISKDLLNRIGLAADATCRQIMITVFCQSFNYFCQQTGSSSDVSHRIAVLQMKEIDDPCTEVTLPLGSSALEDGVLLLRAVQQQEGIERRTRSNHPTPLPIRRIIARGEDGTMTGDTARSPLYVAMETIDNDYCVHPAGSLSSLLRWSSQPSSSIPIHLSLWIGGSTVRLGACYALNDQYHRGFFGIVVREQIERRIYQLAAALGVQTGKLSPHSTPGATPTPGTPPSTPFPDRHHHHARYFPLFPASHDESGPLLQRLNNTMMT